ncbi:hypothetical protein DDB_G0292428 [Dictyostelium discoideum AX4]|uniref:BTB domain-containing protein n=1 Tax=Dictyostelium discoideum TaxID=44689 RepID=Q54D90_DICDI|nr:hypothetical protein DDB_G0292428 [Dictyostelium discoideum AX4]EAL61193.1 hypothetical protein DDB_G0292428 [Dictyostelium discoideum AX4]|eukprot:XP_629606.1 hypothetical protein DDB_G0292428 [Dictyostelium discoideum AX4]
MSFNLNTIGLNTITTSNTAALNSTINNVNNNNNNNINNINNNNNSNNNLNMLSTTISTPTSNPPTLQPQQAQQRQSGDNGGITLTGQLLAIQQPQPPQPQPQQTQLQQSANNTPPPSVENITIYILPVGIQTTSLPPFLMKKHTLFKRLFGHISQRFSIEESQLIFLFQDRIDPEQCPNDIGLNSGETIVVRKLKNKLRANNLHSIFVNNIGSLFNNPVYSDIAFKLLDGSLLLSHKNILSSRCQKFQGMFQNDMKESQLKEIEIVNYEPAVFRKMIEYLYSDSLNEDNIDMVLQLIIIADEYLLDTLKHRCELKLITEINSNNVALFLLKSDIYNCKFLKKSSMEFILGNVKKLFQNKEFNKVLSESPSLLLEVIQEMAPLYEDNVNGSRKSYFTINGN